MFNVLTNRQLYYFLFAMKNAYGHVKNVNIFIKNIEIIIWKFFISSNPRNYLHFFFIYRPDFKFLRAVLFNFQSPPGEVFVSFLRLDQI